MPYIIMKRNDIPAGILQVLDLDPNTSQRNYTIDPPGQTKYVNPVQNDVVATRQPGGGGTPIYMHREARGLAAYLITNVGDGTQTQATGTLTVVAANADAGDTVTIGGVVLTAVAGARTPGADDFSIDSGTEDGIVNELVAAINDPLNSFTEIVTAAADLPNDQVDLTAVPLGTAGNAVSLATSDATFIAVSAANLAGGVDADSLTAAEVNTIASDILTNLLAFGDLTSAAVTANLAAVNAEIQNTVATASVTATQLGEILDILAGRQYVSPAGVQIDTDGSTFVVSPAVGTANGPRFIEGTLRDVFQTGSLSLSFAVGELATFTSSDFVYGGVAGNPNGEAVVVYNDDGTLYSP